LPLILNIVENIGTKKIFTKINLKWNYNNVKEEDEWKVLWQPLVTKLIEVQTINLKNKYCCGDHKRTQQEVSAKLLPYIYKLQMVHATNN